MNPGQAVLLSGGIDSTALAHLLRPEHCIFVDYGQLAAKAEEASASEICQAIGSRLSTVRVDCSSIGAGEMSQRGELPDAPVPEWWPFRNQLLATLAGTRAIQLGIETLLFGAVATDGSHADGRPAFFEALSRVFECQEGKIRIDVPAIDSTTEVLVRRAELPLELLCWTHSCFRGNLACGLCRGCWKRVQVCQGLGIEL